MDMLFERHGANITISSQIYTAESSGLSGDMLCFCSVGFSYAEVCGYGRLILG